MGCNFYTMRKTHIGRRSAAGWYCWDCDITLCKAGNDGVHYDSSNWYESCPVCGGRPIRETLNTSAVGRELGFNKQEWARKHRVSSCSSFRWAIDRDKFLCGRTRRVKNEYGDIFSIDEFRKILEECPIQYLDSIGKEFF